MKEIMVFFKIMQNILITDHDPEILNLLNPYFVDSIKYYQKNYTVSFLGMILHKDNNYFTITLKEPYKGYTEYTPIILFKRDPQTHYFLYEDDHFVKFPYDSKRRKVNIESKEYKLWEEANLNSQLDNPWVVHTKGCDNGSKGWVFKTEEDALLFIKELKNTTNFFPNDFENYYDFLDYFDKNQRWLN